jgi:hypothetical protein
MSVAVRVFPKAFLRAMRAKDRRALGQMTAAEAGRRYEAGQERELNHDVINWLSLQGAWVFTQGMHRKTRGRPGCPDIIACLRGRFVAIELKVGGNRLEPAQSDECTRIREAGGVVIVARSLHDVMDGTGPPGSVPPARGWERWLFLPGAEPRRVAWAPRMFLIVPPWQEEAERRGQFVLRFGPHRGRRLKDVTPEYLRWMLRHYKHLRPGTRRAIERYLLSLYDQ